MTMVMLRSVSVSLLEFFPLEVHSNPKYFRCEVREFMIDRLICAQVE